MSPPLIFWGLLLSTMTSATYSVEFTTAERSFLEYRDGVLNHMLARHAYEQKEAAENEQNNNDSDRKHSDESDREEKSGHMHQIETSQECGFVSNTFRRLQQKYRIAVCQALAEKTPLPDALSRLTAEYAALQWTHDKHFKPFDKGVFNVSFLAHARIGSYGAGDDQACIIDEATGKIIENVAREQMFSRNVPATFSILGGYQDCFMDFDEATDGMKKVIIDGEGRICLAKSHLPLDEAHLRGKTLCLHHQTRQHWFICIRFSPNGHYIVAGATDGVVSIIDTKTAKTLFSLQHPASVTALAVHASGSALLVGLHNGSIHRWEGPSFDDIYALASKEHQIIIPRKELSRPPALMHMSDAPENDPVVTQESSPASCGEISFRNCLADCLACYNYLRNCRSSSCSSYCRTMASCAINCPVGCAYSCCWSCKCLSCICCRRCLVGARVAIARRGGCCDNLLRWMNC